MTFPPPLPPPSPPGWDSYCEQEVGKEWEDFDLCALVGDSSKTPTEVLLIDAHIFNDIIYPGTDLGYRMEVRMHAFTCGCLCFVTTAIQRVVP